MKLLTLLITSACLNLAAAGHAQKISITVENAPLQKIFKLVEQQTEFRFVYTKEQLQHLSHVSLNVQSVTLENVLDKCLVGQPLSYTIEDNIIVIQQKEENKRTNSNVDISGKVTNAEGQPLGGITVTVKGSGEATVTGSNGEFLLPGVEADAILIFTGAETETREIKMNGTKFLAVRLMQKVNELDETIVIGYGITTRRFSTGSVTKITASDICKQPVTNPLAALQGRVPGLVVTATNGLPGSTFTVQIRGQNTINPRPGTINPLNQPLFIIDGVPFAPQNTKINQYGSIASPDGPQYNSDYAGMSPFNSINPADIESIEVLRDADATAIYGSRGANGVILITTKKAKTGKTRFNVNVTSGASRVTRTMPLMNVQQYRMMRQEAFSNDGLVPGTDPGTRFAPELLIFDSSRNQDWKKYFLGRTANTTDINTGISGGSLNTQFWVGAGYHREDYIFPGSFENKRINFMTNIRHASTDRKLQLEFSANYSFDRNTSSGTADVLRSFTLPPNYPEFVDGQDKLVWDYKGVYLFNNPLAYLKQKYIAKNYNLTSHLQLGYEVAPNLIFRTSFGYNTFNGNENAQLPFETQGPFSSPEAVSIFGNNDFQTWLIEPQAEYSWKKGKGKLHILTGGTIQQNTNTSTSITASGYNNDALLGSVSAAPYKSVSDNFISYKYAGLFARVNYIWDKKYIINLTGRRDGSSRFGPDKQFGNFGSAGVGWIFSEEKFVSNTLRSLSFAKLRASYGSTGSDAINDYGYIPRWSVNSGLLFQGTTVYQPQNLFNPRFSWSVTRKLEAGLELGFWQDRLLFNAVWFRNRCDNQLVSYPLPSQTGFSGVTENFPALVQNKGWEFLLTTVNYKKVNFNWTTSFNMSFVRNKLIAYPGIENSSYRFSYVVGESVNVLNKFIFAGINSTTGIYEFFAKDGTHTSTPVDFTDYRIIGNRDPEFYGGLNNSLRFKEIQFDLFLEFRKQEGPNYLQQVYSNGPAGTIYLNLPVTFLDRWQKTGDQAAFQKFTARRYSTATGRATQVFALSDGAYSDASYIRFKTISVSYNFSKKWISKLKIEGCRIFINAQNMFTITNYKGNDPETMSFYSVPPLKTIVAGLQFTL